MALALLKQAANAVNKYIFKDKGIWKWCAIFGGIYIGSRLFFYRFYYPSLLRAFSPPIFLESDNKKLLLSRQSSISNAFPQSLLRRLSVQPLHSEFCILFKPPHVTYFLFLCFLVHCTPRKRERKTVNERQPN